MESTFPAENGIDNLLKLKGPEMVIDYVLIVDICFSLLFNSESKYYLILAVKACPCIAPKCYTVRPVRT